MHVYISWESDTFHDELQSTIMANDAEAIRHLNQRAEHSNLIWSSWSAARGGSIIFLSAGRGLADIEAAHLGELPNIHQQYGDDLGQKVSVGVGTNPFEADRARKFAWKLGGDRIIIFEEGLEDFSHTEEESAELSKAETWQDLTPEQKSEFRRQYREDIQKLAKMEFPMAAVRDGQKYEILGPLSNVQGQWGSDHIVLAKSEDGKKHFLDARELCTDGQPLVRPAPPRFGYLFKADEPGRHIPSRPAAPAKPTMSGEHEEAQVAQQAAEAQQAAVPEQTDAGEGFLGQLKALADGQQDQDSQAVQDDAGDDRAEVKATVVKILKDIQAKSPNLNEIREKDPDLYNSISGLVKVLITMTRELVKEQPQQAAQPTQKEELDPAHPPPEGSRVLDKEDIEKAALPMPKAPTRHELNLPVGSQKDSSPGGSQDAGKLKVQDPKTGKEKWRSVRAGLVMDPGGAPTSSRNPSGE